MCVRACVCSNVTAISMILQQSESTNNMKSRNVEYLINPL